MVDSSQDASVPEWTGSEVEDENLLGEVGLDSEALARRKAVAGFTEADERRLAEMKPVVDGAVDDLLAGYYEKVSSYPETREILERSPDSVRALERSQRRYLSDLTGGRYDEAYFERRARMGKVHDVFDLGPKSYFAGYSAYYEGVVRALAEDVKSDLVASDDERSGESPAVDPDSQRSPDPGERSRPAAQDAADRSPDAEAPRRRTPIFEGQEYPPEGPRHDGGAANGRRDARDDAPTDGRRDWQGNQDDRANRERRESERQGPRESAVTDDGARSGDADTLGAREAVDLMGERMLSFLKLVSLDQQVAMDTYTNLYRKRAADEIARQKEVTEEVETTVTELEYAAEEVARSSQEISAMAVQQSESTETVAGEVSNLSATVEEVASTAVEVEATSEEAETLAVQGKKSATEAIEMMETVNDYAERVTSDVGHLQRRVNEIDDIVEVINDIADQTNLLALNASIEAARAGEAGEGFAVVANEIKGLAEEASRATTDIEDSILDIQAKTYETVDGIETMGERVESGSDTIEETIELFDEIADVVQEAEVGIREINDATDDQAAFAEEVASMVDEAFAVSEQTQSEASSVAAAAEEQTASLSEANQSVHQLSELVTDLHEQVSNFETRASVTQGPTTPADDGDGTPVVASTDGGIEEPARFGDYLSDETDR